MLREAKLKDYLIENLIKWVPDMPDGVPPEDICIPNNHFFYRFTKEVNITEQDLITYYEMNSERDWGANFAESFALSLFDDINKASRLLSIPSLRNSKGISKITINAQDGVVKQTSKPYHYSWWKTNQFDINTVEMEKVL